MNSSDINGKVLKLNHTYLQLSILGSGKEIKLDPLEIRSIDFYFDVMRIEIFYQNLDTLILQDNHPSTLELMKKWAELEGVKYRINH